MAHSSSPRIIAFVDGTPKAQEVFSRIKPLIEEVPLEEANVILAVGGDGYMLSILHKNNKNHKLPVYGINAGNIGFLMNQHDEKRPLGEKICLAKVINLFPLKMEAFGPGGEKIGEKIAINDVFVFRSSAQSAKLSVHVGGELRLPEIFCDGLVLATPAGSTAYNMALNGPVIPLGTNILALTPVAPFRPRHWRGALLPDNVVIKIDALNPEKRPVSATADNETIDPILHVTIACQKDNPIKVLFDAEHNLEARILREQFTA